MDQTRLKSIGGFLVYGSITYRDINPYLKGLHLTLDTWIPHRDEEGRKIQGELLKIAEMERKWDSVKEVNKLILLERVPRMGDDLVVPGKLIEA